MRTDNAAELEDADLLETEPLSEGVRGPLCLVAASRMDDAERLAPAVVELTTGEVQQRIEEGVVTAAHPPRRHDGAVLYSEDGPDTGQFPEQRPRPAYPPTFSEVVQTSNGEEDPGLRALPGGEVHELVESCAFLCGPRDRNDGHPERSRYEAGVENADLNVADLLPRGQRRQPRSAHLGRYVD